MTDNISKFNLSMAGCGFLGIYHIGVAAALEKYVPHFKKREMSGASAGAMAGVYFLCDVPVENSVHDILDMCRISRSKTLGLFCPTVNVTQILRNSMERHLPLNAHELVNGKIHISMTRCYDFKNIIISQFESREDLIQAVLCSGFIPIFSGWKPPKFRGVRHMDGGYSDNHPILNENTITVSPFSGESDICPRDHINIFNMMVSNTSFQISRLNFGRVSRALFPSKPVELFNTCEQGFSDTVKFLSNNNMIQCTNCEFQVKTENDENNNNTICKLSRTSQYQLSITCYDCEIKKRSAISDSLPKRVTSVIDKFVDKKEPGFFKWLSNLTGEIVDSAVFRIFQYA